MERPNTTVAEGLSTLVAFELPQRIQHELLDDFVPMEDGAILDAVAIMIDRTHTLVEPAGAAPLAALMSPSLRERMRVKRVALICLGGNISHAQLMARRPTPG